MKLYSVLIVVSVVIFFMLLPEPENQTLSVTDSTQALDAGKNHGQNKSASDEKPHSTNENFLIRNVRLFDGTQVHEAVDVLVENYKISAIGSGLDNVGTYPEIKAVGQTIIPGLIDAHTHSWGDALSQALNFGVTTELDMFTSPEFANPHQKRRNELSNNLHADLYSATILATAPRGHGTEYGMDIPVLSSVEQVASFVEERLEQGADYIKAVYDTADNPRQHFPSISLEILEALASAANSAGKLFVVHVDNLKSAKEAIRAGANGLVHSFMDQPIDAEFIQLMLDHKAFMVPTLSVEASVVGEGRGKQLLQDAAIGPFIANEQKQQLSVTFPDFGIAKEGLAIAMDSVMRLHQVGIPILAGSDAPNPGTTHGASLHSELALLVEAGLTPKEALYSATGAINQIFPVGARGVVSVGAPATMILINGNPITDISHSRQIRRIWKNGFEVIRARYDESPQNTKQQPQGLVTDFNLSDVKTLSGMGIMPSSDQIAGGQSTVNVFHGKRDNDTSDRYLHITGEIKAGFGYPWGGVAYILGQTPTEGIDLSGRQYLIFDAKGSSKTSALTIMMFQAGSYTPATRTQPLSKEWQTYRLKLADFRGVDHHWVNNLSIVAPGNFGEYEFSIDNIRIE